MNKIDIQQEDVFGEFKDLIKIMKEEKVNYLKKDEYTFKKAGSDHELNNIRTDVFSSLNSFENFDSLLKTPKNKIFTKSDYNNIFDDYLTRELLFIEGRPILNVYYTNPIFHNLEIIKNNKSIFAILGSFSLRLNKIIEIGMKAGLTNHEDFCLSYIPKLNLFKEMEVLEKIAFLEKENKSKRLKNKKKKLLKMDFTDEEGFYARLNFHKIFLAFLELVKKPYFETNISHITELIDILKKMLIIIKKTSKLEKNLIFENKLLTTFLCQPSVRKIENYNSFEEVTNKYDKIFESIKYFMQIFFNKKMSIHKLIHILQNYTDNYNNLLSRSILFNQFQSVAKFSTENFEKFLKKIIKNEIKIYLDKKDKKIFEINEKKIIEKVIQQCDTSFFNVITKFCFDLQKQEINLKKSIHESTFILQFLYNMDKEIFGEKKSILKNIGFFLLYKTKIRILEIGVCLDLYDNYELIYIFLQLFDFYKILKINYSYAFNCFDDNFFEIWELKPNLLKSKSFDENQKMIFENYLFIDAKMNYVNGLAKLFIFLFKKKLIQNLFGENEEFIYNKRFEKFGKGVKFLKFENFKNILLENLDKKDSVIIDEIKSDFLNVTKKLKILKEIKIIDIEMFEKFCKIIIKNSFILFNLKKMDNFENFRFCFKGERNFYFTFSLEKKK